MNSPRSTLFAATTALLFAIPSAHAAAVIDSITSSEGPPSSDTDTAGILTSITVGGTPYSNLVAPTSLSSGDTVDYVAIGALPTTVDDALGGLNLDTGTLNYDYTVQFGQTVQDQDIFFILNNTSSPPQDIFNAFTIQAIDSGGTNVGSATNFPNINTIPEIVIPRNWNRTGGSTLPGRRMYGYSFTLDDLGLAGNTTVTGYSLTTSNLDPAVVGLAVIPEPASIVLVGLALLGVAAFKRR